jgi:hypothetical protein
MTVHLSRILKLIHINCSPFFEVTLQVTSLLDRFIIIIIIIIKEYLF